MPIAMLAGWLVVSFVPGFPLNAQRAIQQVSALERVQALTIQNSPTWWFSSANINPQAESQSFLAKSGSAIDAPTGDWQLIPVPDRIEKHVSFRPQSFWYRKVFVLDDSSNQPLSLNLGAINDRDRTYLNGVLIGETGAWDPPEPQAYDRIRIYSIPDGLIHRKGPNILLINVHRYFSEVSGIERHTPAIGTTRVILHDYYMYMWVRGVALAAYPPLGILFLIIFAVRRTQREYLYFGIFSIVLTLYQLHFLNVKYETGLSVLFLKKSEYILLYLLFPSFSAFVENYFGVENIFGGKWLRYLIRALNVYIMAHATFILFTGHLDILRTVLGKWVQPVWIPILLYFAIITVQRALQRSRNALLLLPGTAVLISSVSIDVLIARGVIHFPATIPFAFSFFILSIALILALRFAESLVAVERTALQLSATNSAYSRFVPMEFLHFLDRQAITEVRLGDQTRREMTILFSDIRSFTEISETMSPEDNFNFLNSYLKRMQPHIQTNAGFIDKYIGDAIMALFPEQPSNAIDASIAMQLEISAFNKNRQDKGYSEIKAGIGIHTGSLMLGTIGAAARMEGTVISDAVNLAARVEGLTKYYGAGILITEHVLAKLPDPSRYKLRVLERVRVKGKSDSVSVIEILDGRPDAELCIETLDDFERGIELYLNKEWAAALAIFERILAKNPSDLATSVMIKRASQNHQHGVPDAWEGIIDMDSK
ncbi:MAG: adenylate/guanylate cyclase domain-containing protein [Leptospirales bacterium]|nr:adenylate/guanylate cyclase domain-containing protein [Leptospirales bacterium]